MRKGFIGTTLIIAIGVLGLIGGAVSYYASIQEVESVKQELIKERSRPRVAVFGPTNSSVLGAITGSGVFPTSSRNNFQDNDIINAGDWNALERKIGIDNSTDTTSLDYKLRHASSIDPGHIHELADSASGTLPVENGGTELTTLTLNNVILGNGTSAVQFVAPGTNGNILTSNGTTWISQEQSGNTFTITAGENFNTGDSVYIPNSYGAGLENVSSSPGNRCGYSNDQDTLNGGACGQTWMTSSTGFAYQVVLPLLRTGSPAGNTRVLLYQGTSSVDLATPIASTTLVAESTFATEAASSTNQKVTLPFQFPAFIHPNTVYFLVATSTSANSGTDHPNWQGFYTNYTSGGCFAKNSASFVPCGGAPALNDLNFRIDMNPATTTLAYRASGQSTTTSNSFVGLANATTTSGSTLTIVTAGAFTKSSGLSPGLQYYLSNAFGAIQSFAASTSRNMGISVNSTTIAVTNTW